MKVYSRDLKRARRWLGAGRSLKVIHYLESKVPLYIEDPLYYAILGRACLSAGLLKDADDWLNRGLQADPQNLDVRLVLAVLHLRRKDPPAAVRTWLEILEDDPGNKYAGRGLKALRKISDPLQQDRFIERFDPRRYMPSVQSGWPGRILLILIAMLLILVGLYFREDLSQIRLNRDRRPGELPQSGQIMTESENVLFPMDQAELNRTLRKALRLYQSYQDNEARAELNRIVYSNAGEDVRQQAEGLIDALGEPDIESFSGSLSYKDVQESPWLYNGCWILWQGMTANAVAADDSVSFDFLAGFQDGRILEGRVPVVVPFPAVIEPLPLEILAQVSAREDGRFILTAKTLHFLR